MRREAQRPTISIVIPCYNEEAVLPEAIRRIKGLLNKLVAENAVGPDSCILLVDDGSKDRTWPMIREASTRDANITGLKLSRNRGHQIALLAGLMNAPGDAVVSLDADLQDDPDAIEEMLDAYRQGAEVVYGVRKRRASDSVFKRFTAESYYKLLAKFDVEIVFNHADYRLLSRRAVESLREYGEENLFLRGIIPQLGYRSAIVTYDRAERYAGDSKYPMPKMLAFAWEGITSFSATPLRMITGIGVLISAASFVVTFWALWIRLFTTSSVPGWASIAIPVLFLGGVQLLCIGIIGEYVAKIYNEVKCRPRFFVEEKCGMHNMRTMGDLPVKPGTALAQ